MSKELLIQIGTAAAGNENLIAVHLSDNCILPRKDLFDEMLDIFGLSTEILNQDVSQFNTNKPVIHSEKLRDICRKFTKNRIADNIDDASAYNKIVI
jgi:uncharacterized protein YlaN (UPF0358 family)